MKRRWLSNVAIVVLAVVPAVVVLIGLAVGDRERMVGYHEVARIGEDGAQITEVIDYDFGAGNERHGIYRTVPGLQLETVTVSSPTAPDQFELTPGRIRIGDPNVTVDGTHRYEIGYELDTLVQGDRLAWNVVGTEWSVPIESVEAHIVSQRSLRDVTCDRGDFGDVGGCEAVEVEPGHLVVRTGDLSAGEAVTVGATLGGPIEFPPTPTIETPALPGQTGAPLLAPVFLGWVAAALAGLFTGRLLRHAGREVAPAGYSVGDSLVPTSPGTTLADAPRVDVTELTEDLPPRITPPTTLTPAQGGVVRDEDVTDADQAAWLLGQAQHGAVALDGDPKKPTLRWVGGHGATSNAPLLTMFDGRPTVELGTYDKSFAAGWSMVEAELEKWRSTSGLWSEVGERRHGRAIVAGVILGIVGLVVAGLLAFRWSLADPSVAQLALLTVPVGVALGLLFRAGELPVRTADGSARYIEVEAFRRYLAEAEVDDIERARSAGVVHDHLAWAVALGVADRWLEAVEGSSVRHDPSMNYPLFLMAGHLHSSTGSTSTAPSSSGGGGGGGGAGGGGGGGGGGSW